jgi:ABC-type molybdate transport system substrate-binding protein
MFYAQLVNHAPLDLFLSADGQYPNKLAQQGMILPAASSATPTVASCSGPARPPASASSIWAWTSADTDIDIVVGQVVGLRRDYEIPQMVALLGTDRAIELIKRPALLI